MKNVSICFVISEMQNCCSSTRDEIQEDGDVYDRLRLGWNLRFPAEIEKPLAFATQRRHLSLALLQNNTRKLEDDSFKNVRELLLLSYVNNVVSEREFVLLYDAYQSKNPDFNYQQYDPFNLDNID